MDLDYPPLNRVDLSEQAYTVLRDGIFKRQLKAGEKVLVDEIAKMLGVSRTPVLVALQRLAREGLVEIVPRRGTFVTELPTQKIVELFQVRLMIELYAADLILENGLVSQFAQAIAPAMAQMDTAADGELYRDYDAFISSDHDLHMALVRQVGNEYLVQLYEGLNVHINVARAHYLSTVEGARQTQKEHRDILAAFERREAVAVRAAIKTHINNVERRILEIIEERGVRAE